MPKLNLTQPQTRRLRLRSTLLIWIPMLVESLTYLSLILLLRLRPIWGWGRPHVFEICSGSPSLLLHHMQPSFQRLMFLNTTRATTYMTQSLKMTKYVRTTMTNHILLRWIEYLTILIVRCLCIPRVGSLRTEGMQFFFWLDWVLPLIVSSCELCPSRLARWLRPVNWPNVGPGLAGR